MELEQELQTEETASESLSTQGTDSAPVEGKNLNENTAISSEGESETKPAESNEPAGFTKRIHQKHHELMEEKRARASVEQQLEELRKQVPQETKPVIPEIPDPYEDNFDELMAQRDTAIKAEFEFNSREQNAQAQAQQAQQKQANEQQEALVKTVNTYSERAGKLNISESELKVAGETVAAYGIDNQLAQYILSDDDGPLITTYLAKNPAELETLRTMNPMQSAVYIANTVKSKASANRNTVNTPSPADTLGGGGAPPSERGPRGATFE